MRLETETATSEFNNEGKVTVELILGSEDSKEQDCESYSQRSEWDKSV